MNSRHFLLADGTYKAEIHLQPIHYKAADGTWQPIDTALVASKRSGYAYANEKNTLRSYLPASGSGWFRVESDQGAISFRPLGALGNMGSVAGNRANYPNVSDAASVSYSAEPGQLKELITLTAPGAPPTFRYAVRLEGLTARKNRDNSIALADSAGNTALLIAAPWMKDAAGKCSGAISVDLAPSGDGFIYTMAPDPQWLATARYPVAVDPTITQSWTAVNRYDGTSRYADSFWTPGIDDEEPGSGPYLAVGIDTDHVTAYRSILSFNATGVPAGSEIQSATLVLAADHATSDANLQVQIYGVNKALSPSGLSSQYPTPNNIGLTADDLKKYPSVLAPLEPNFLGAYKYFNVADLVQNWADDRTTALNFMIRDTQEGLDPMNRYPAVVYFYASNSTLTFTYTTPGWYMFQGNRRHTGLAAQPLSPGITKKWSAPLATGQVKAVLDMYRYLEPGVIAVPDPTPGSTATLVYAAVGLAPNAFVFGTYRPSCLVYRAKDNNGSLGQLSSVPIDSFYPTGTPLVVNNTLVLTGITNFRTDQPDYPQRGCVVALDATTLQVLWRRNLPGSIYSSPVYWSGNTTYKDQNGATHTNQGGCVIVAADSTFIQPYSEEWGRTSYLFALSLADGKHVWGKAYRTLNPADPLNGELVPNVTPPQNGIGYSTPSLGGLVPLVYNSTYSSPAIMGDGVYIQDHSCVVNARNLADGSFRWEGGVDSAHEQSSISIFDKKLYWGGMSIDTPPYPGFGGVSCLKETTLFTGEYSFEGQWTTMEYFATYPDTIGAVWGGVVVHPTERIAIFADLAGNVHGADADGVSGTLETVPIWSAPVSVGSPMFCSPLLASDPATGRWNAFVGADDGKVHVLQAQETPVGNRELSSLTDGGNALSGRIRSSMASLNGRLYVLSAGETTTGWGWGQFTKLPTLYCFGQ